MMKKKKNDGEGILENLYLKIISEAIGFTKKIAITFGKSKQKKI